MDHASRARDEASDTMSLVSSGDALILSGQRKPQGIVFGRG
ncbi:hypothetical protein WMF39_40955 [Sorangium sp. So ce1504]